MAPHKVASLVQFLHGAGPLAICVDTDGVSSLFPVSVKVVGASGLTRAFAQQADHGSATISEPSPSSVREELAAVAGASVPSQLDNSSNKWIFQDNEQFATAITICIKMRPMQRAGALAVRVWLSDDQEKCSTLADGFMKDMKDFKGAILDAERLKASSVEINNFLVKKGQDSEQNARHRQIAQVLGKKCMNFAEVVDEGHALHESLLNVSSKKCSTYVDEGSGILQKCFREDFREWMGLQVRAQRKPALIRKYMLSDLDRDIGEIGLAQTELVKRIGAVAAVQKELNVREASVKAERILAASRYYVTGTQITMNLVVKPAKKVPLPVIQRSVRGLLLGVSSMNYWVPDSQQGAAESGADGGQALGAPTDIICEERGVASFWLVVQLDVPSLLVQRGVQR